MAYATFSNVLILCKKRWIPSWKCSNTISRKRKIKKKRWGRRDFLTRNLTGCERDKYKPLSETKALHRWISSELWKCFEFAFHWSAAMAFSPCFYNLHITKAVCIHILSHAKKKKKLTKKVWWHLKTLHILQTKNAFLSSRLTSTEWLLTPTSHKTAVPKSNKHCCLLKSLQPGHVSSRQNKGKASTPIAH